MKNLESEQRVERPSSLVWIERGSNVMLGVMLLAAVFLISLGACKFNFSESPDAAIGGLDAMSNGILAAIIGITGYAVFFGIGYLLANLRAQDDSRKPA